MLQCALAHCKKNYDFVIEVMKAINDFVMKAINGEVMMCTLKVMYN